MQIQVRFGVRKGLDVEKHLLAAGYAERSTQIVSMVVTSRGMILSVYRRQMPDMREQPLK